MAIKKTDKCRHDGCNEFVRRVSTVNGVDYFGSDCVKCHAIQTALNSGFGTPSEYTTNRKKTRAKSKGYKSVAEMSRAENLVRAKKRGYKSVSEMNRAENLERAKKRGYKSVAEMTRAEDREKAKSLGLTYTEYKNRNNYKQHRLDYCENRDGRLGFKCTTTIVSPALQLHADHINGNYKDNRPENIQTLCGTCHPIKSVIFGDGTTPGRKNGKGLIKRGSKTDRPLTEGARKKQGERVRKNVRQLLPKRKDILRDLGVKLNSRSQNPKH